MLLVDLFDAYSIFHFGTIKIPLNSLLRQGKELNSTGQEWDIWEPKYGKIIGKLQIIMNNIITVSSDPDFFIGKGKHNQPNQK